MYTLTVQAVLSAELFALKHAFGLTDLGAKGLSVLKKLNIYLQVLNLLINNILGVHSVKI